MKSKILTVTLVLMMLALAAGAENPRDMKFSELTFDPAVPERFVADNGLVVFFLEYHELPVVSFTAYFKGGEAYDAPDKAGLTGVTAELIRTGGAGSRDPETVDQDLDFFGTRISSASAADNLTVSMQTLKKDISLGFEILADMLVEPRFDSAKMALEISNRQDQIRRQNDNPWDISRRVFYQTVYTGHPYGRFATLASLSNLTRDDILKQHQKFYAPDNCIMAISGDLTAAEVKDIISRYFSNWTKSGAAIEPLAPAETRYAPGVYYAEKDMNQANIRFGTLSLDDKNPDRYALELVNFALGGGGFTSRLTGEVRTTAGLAYSVGSILMVRPCTGCLFGYCLTRADAMSQAVQMMLDIVKEVKADGITEEELTLARESLINSYIFDYDTPQELTAAYAYQELRGFPPDQLQRNLEEYKKVTLADCRRVAAKYLDTENIALVITGNKDLFDKPLETFGRVTAVSMEIK
ncbi:MAG: M16 family metallopeptidase [Candidatus Zixiibacteriota bacterium]